MGSCELLIGSANGCNELVDFFGVFDAFLRLPIGSDGLYPGADVNGQRLATRPHLGNAIAHVCSSESTTQDEVSVDAWRKK